MSKQEHKLKRIQPGIYEYRGIEIERNDWVKAGYYRRWEANFGRIAESTLRKCKEAIDNKLNI